MKKFCITFLLSGIIILTAVLADLSCFSVGSGKNTAYGRGGQAEFLRIHIRADSNEEAAQAVKYEVKEDVVAFLTPVVATCDSLASAAKRLEDLLDEIGSVAKKRLEQRGFSYGAAAKLTRENFPTRVYGEYTLAAGEYLALVLELGSGKGDNWWCVVYPPLCFTADYGANVVYKSLILEKIEKWKARREK